MKIVTPFLTEVRPWTVFAMQINNLFSQYSRLDEKININSWPIYLLFFIFFYHLPKGAWFLLQYIMEYEKDLLTLCNRENFVQRFRAFCFCFCYRNFYIILFLLFQLFIQLIGRSLISKCTLTWIWSVNIDMIFEMFANKVWMKSFQVLNLYLTQ